MESTLRYTVIKNLDQYNAYCNEHEAMMAEDEERYRDEIDLLELLIEDYDQRAVAANQSSTLNPVELLKKTMESSNLDQVELANSLNIPSDHLKAILNYKVNLDKVVAAKLAQYFSMRVEAFDREYELS